MNSPIPTKTYTGLNEAHSKFAHQYRYLNALYYLIVSNEKTLASNLKRASQTTNSVIGVVTHSISNTQFQGVFAPVNDARDMVNNFHHFLSILQKQTITSSYKNWGQSRMALT